MLGTVGPDFSFRTCTSGWSRVFCARLAYVAVVAHKLWYSRSVSITFPRVEEWKSRGTLVRVLFPKQTFLCFYAYMYE